MGRRLIQSRVYTPTGSEEKIFVTPRRNSRSVRLRRGRDGQLKASLPYGMEVSEAFRVLDELYKRLSALPPRKVDVDYSSGREIDCNEFSIKILEDLSMPRLRIDVAWPVVYIKFNHSGFSSSTLQRAALDKAVMLVARHGAQSCILPMAQKIAAELGCHPSRWKIGSGRRILGTCKSDRSITLSCVLVFLPDELRRYVICHELAHLTHMNHSPQFHELLDRYLEGREKELVSKLHKYMSRFPNMC